MLEVALRLAAAGRRIFPADPESKRPMIDDFVERATTNLETICAWWAERPEAMPSIALESTDCVIDIDPRNGGDTTLERVLAENPELVPLFKSAPMVKTASGGAHFYFTVPADQPVKNGPWDRERYPGIDIKTRGGYVVGPGAARADGALYTVVRDCAAPPAPAIVLRDRARTHDAVPVAAPVIWAAGDELEGAMSPALVALLAPRLTTRGSRHDVARAVGGALAVAGWTDDGIAELVSGLPSDDPAARVRDALGAAGRARAGEVTPGFGALVRAGYAPGVVTAMQTMATGGALESLAVATETARAADAAATAVTMAGTPSAWGTLVAVDDLRAPLEPVNHLCEGLVIAPGAPTLFAGYGGIGKSMLAQLFALCVVSGKPMFGTMPVRRGRGLHFDYEQGRRMTRARYQRIAAELGISELDKMLEVISAPRVNMLLPEIESLLVQKTDGVALCVIDSLKAATPGVDENDTRIREPLDMLGRVSEVTGCTFIVIHHARKPTKDSTGGNLEMRGSSAINDAAQTVIMLEPASHGFNIVAGKIRDGRKFGRIGVAIQDTPIEGVPFDGLRLHVIDGDARAVEELKERDVTDKATILHHIAGAPGGVYARGLTGLYALTAGKMAQTRVRTVVELLVQDGSIREDKPTHTFIATRNAP